VPGGGAADAIGDNCQQTVFIAAAGQHLHKKTILIFFANPSLIRVSDSFEIQIITSE
jgi:hypothetical protein